MEVDGGRCRRSRARSGRMRSVLDGEVAVLKVAAVSLPGSISRTAALPGRGQSWPANSELAGLQRAGHEVIVFVSSWRVVIDVCDRSPLGDLSGACFVPSRE